MIVLISGAKKNVGDFLIVDRAYKLLERYVDKDITVLNRFHDLSDKLDVFNKSKAIILGGGPAYASNVFPDIYPFFKFYDEITTPVFPMGIGWSGQHFKNPEKFQFTETSKSFLKTIHNQIPYSSCRDVITQEIVKNAGVENVLMTGCPVWYDLEKLNQSYQHKPVSKIVITTGASQSLVLQTLNLIKTVRKHFKKAEIYLTYHRGILPGKHTPPRKGLAYSSIAVLAQRYNVKVLDVSGGVDKIEFYKDCDLHVGYRVHAHLMFISNRKPSILINEDGRGVGMNTSLMLPVFNYDEVDLVQKIDWVLTKYQEEQFKSFDETFSFIDSNFNIMKTFLDGIKATGK